MNEMKLLSALIYVPYLVTAFIVRGTWKVGKFVYRLIKGRKKPSTHGDSDWATDAQLRKGGYMEPEGFLVMVTKSGKRIFTRAEKSVLVLAGPGSGKSQSTLACIHAKTMLPEYKRQHLLFHDIADELWTHGAPVLEKAGYLVSKIDLVKPREGVGYDIRSYLNGYSRNFDADCKALCELLVPGEPGSKQPHFVEYARIMLQDVIRLDMQHEGGKKMIGDCVDMLLDDDQRKKMLARMKRIGGFRASGIFDKMSGPEGVSMLSTSLRKLDPWTLNSIRDVSKVDRTPEKPMGWTFEQMFTCDRPCALFVRTGLRPGGGDFARAVFGNAINTIRRMWDETGKGPSRPVQAFIDEAGRLGQCQALLDGHNELRKAGYTQWLNYLGLSAMKGIYGEADAMTLFNGCDHLILPGNKDMRANATYSEIIGDMTIENSSRNESEYGASKGLSEQARRLVKADEIRRGNKGEAFVVLDNLSARGLTTFEPQKDGVRYR